MRFFISIFLVFILSACNVGFFDLKSFFGNAEQVEEEIEVVSTSQEVAQEIDNYETLDEEGNAVFSADDEREEEARDRNECNGESRRGDPEVSLSPLDYIDSINAGRYELKGRCSEKNRAVQVTVNGYKLKKTPHCDKGRWEVFLDLAGLSVDSKKVSFRITHGPDSNVVCEDIKVAFTCPKNYIPIPRIQDIHRDESLHANSFCVMKYEAKIEKSGGGVIKAISQSDGRPIANISHTNARTLCQANGSRYDLISNDQWQTIARLVEEHDKNWSLGKGGVVNGNILNCGVSRGAPQPASRDDKNDCSLGIRCGSQWHYRRRTHLITSSNLVIWDICGNVGEMMKDKTDTRKLTSSIRQDEPVSKLSGERNFRNLFGPKKNYSGVGYDLKRKAYWGLGYAELSDAKNLIIRGGQSREAGVFSVNLENDQSDSRVGHNVGFRCVYIP